jgi:hypothetical protein
VIDVLPKKCGVQVQFMDLVEAGSSANDFVRVLQPRMSKGGGAALWLPEIGDLGMVGVDFQGYYVWIGSLPYQDVNQVDSTKDICYLRHQSGCVLQIRPNGDTEILHSSGSRFTIGKNSGALPVLQASSQPGKIGDTEAPNIEISHSSGASIKIDNDGAVTISGCASVTFQEGDKRFCMETLVEKFNTHTHLYSPGPSSPVDTAVPTVPLVKNEVCSPSTFQGPEGA